MRAAERSQALLQAGEEGFNSRLSGLYATAQSSMPCVQFSGFSAVQLLIKLNNSGEHFCFCTTSYWSSLQIVPRVPFTHLQAAAIYESDQTSWLIWHRGLGQGSVLAVGLEMLRHQTVFVLPAYECTTDSMRQESLTLSETFVHMENLDLCVFGSSSLRPASPGFAIIWFRVGMQTSIKAESDAVVMIVI